MSKPIYSFNGYSLQMFKIHKQTEAQLKVIPLDEVGHVRVQTVNIANMDKPDHRGGIWTFDIGVLRRHLSDLKIITRDACNRRIANIEEIEERLNNEK